MVGAAEGVAGGRGAVSAHSMRTLGARHPRSPPLLLSCARITHHPQGMSLTSAAGHTLTGLGVKLRCVSERPSKGAEGRGARAGLGKAASRAGSGCSTHVADATEAPAKGRGAREGSAAGGGARGGSGSSLGVKEDCVSLLPTKGSGARAARGEDAGGAASRATSWGTHVSAAVDLPVNGSGAREEGVGASARGELRGASLAV